MFKFLEKKITIYNKIIKIMKKLLLSVTILTTIFAFSLRENNDEIKKQVEKYAKDSLSVKFNQYKPVTTNFIDTIKVNEFIEGDSIALNLLMERETSPFTMLTQREIINQELELRKKLAPSTIDYKTIKLYQKNDLKVKSLLKASKESSKNLNPNNEVYSLIHTFEYIDKKGFTITDSAMFIYSPENIRIISNGTKFSKGVNCTGTIKQFKSYMLELMSKISPKSNTKN